MVGQEAPGPVESVLAAGPGTEQQREELFIGKSGGADAREALAGTFLAGEIADPENGASGRRDFGHGVRSESPRAPGEEAGIMARNWRKAKGERRRTNAERR